MVRPKSYQQIFLDNSMMERTIIADSNPVILKELMAYTVSEYYSFLIARYNASEKVREQIEKQREKSSNKK